MPPSRTWLWLALVLIANYFLARIVAPPPEPPLAVPYTVFKEQVANRNVEAIYSRGETLTGRFSARRRSTAFGRGQGMRASHYGARTRSTGCRMPGRATLI
jgi:hypothetical protein